MVVPSCGRGTKRFAGRLLSRSFEEEIAVPTAASKPYPPRETRLSTDASPRVDLAKAPNDADDTSDAACPTTDHDAQGWRATPPAKP